MALNVELLLKELQFLTIHPEQHEQGFWAESRTEVPLEKDQSVYDVVAPRPSACGSFGCLAGNTTIHEGVELDWYHQTYFRENGKKIQVWQADNVLDEYITIHDEYLGTYTEKKSISAKAQELLDLTEWQAEKLFDGNNTQQTLWTLAEQFTGGEISASTSEYDQWNERSYAYALKVREDVVRAKAQAEATD